MSENKALVAICAGHAQAERAILELKRLGFDVKNLSAFGKAYASEEEVVGLYTAGGRLWARGGSVAFWERLWDLLGDGGFFLVPGIGPVVLAGSFVHTLVAAIDDRVAVGGLSTLGAALYSLGFPRDSILRCETEIRARECALVALGSSELVTKAMAWLKKAGISEVTAGDGCLLGNPDKVPQMAH
ncbi:MAG: hypothetical protein ACLQNE_34955 [Thermoguttaceae bacterium]|jgi:rhodanese-related sulfurtransferase